MYHLDSSDQFFTCRIDLESDDGYHLTSSAVGIDATYPLDQTWPEEADVPGWESFSLPELDNLKR